MSMILDVILFAIPSYSGQAGRQAGREGGREAGRQGGREAGRQGGRERLLRDKSQIDVIECV